jgi:hypothetical protein
VTSHLTEKLSKLCDFERQLRRAKKCLSSRLLHRELRSLLRESLSFLSSPADTKMASSQGTQPSKLNKRQAVFAFMEAYSSLLENFSDNIMADVASKQQTTALFLSTTATRTTRHTELTKN